MQNQANELPSELQKTAIAQSMENLGFGESSQSQQSEQSQSAQEHDYSHLDKFASASSSDVGEAGEVVESEEMNDEDVIALAGYGVSSLADFIESTIEAPVTIDNDTRKVVAEKAAPVVRKYCKGGMPPWLVRWKEEIELGIVLGSAALSVYKQIKAHEKESGTNENSETEVATNGN